MSETVMLYATFPNEDAAMKTATALVEARLAACANILGAINSVYFWQGAVENSAEIAMLVKTTAAQAPAARDKILDLHSYDTPCVIALPIEARGSNPDFLAWVTAGTSRSGGEKG